MYNEEQQQTSALKHALTFFSGSAQYSWDTLINFIRTNGSITAAIWYSYRWTEEVFLYFSGKHDQPPPVTREYKSAAFIMMVIAINCGFFNFVMHTVQQHCIKLRSQASGQDRYICNKFINMLKNFFKLTTRSVGVSAAIWATFEQGMAIDHKDINSHPELFELIALFCATLSFVLLIYEAVFTYKATASDKRKISRLCGIIDTFQNMVRKSISTGGPVWAMYSMASRVLIPVAFPEYATTAYGGRFATASVTLSLSTIEAIRNQQSMFNHSGLGRLIAEVRGLCNLTKGYRALPLVATTGVENGKDMLTFSAGQSHDSESLSSIVIEDPHNPNSIN